MQTVKYSKILIEKIDLPVLIFCLFISLPAGLIHPEFLLNQGPMGIVQVFLKLTISLIFCYSLFLALSPYKKTFYLILSPFFIFSILELGFFLIYKTPLHQTEIETTLASNFREILEFLKSFKMEVSIAAFIVLVFLFVIIWGSFHLKKIEKINRIQKYLGVLFTSIFVFSYFFPKTQNYLETRISPFKSLKKIQELYKNRTYIDQIRSKRKSFSYNAKSTMETLPNTILIVVGESVGSQYMNLYGNKILNTPFLSNSSDIRFFKNMISGAALTESSLLLSMTPARTANFKESYKFKALPVIFSDLGYETLWISNQDKYGFVTNDITLIAKDTQKTIFLNKSLVSMHFDNILLGALAEHYDKNKKQVIFLHMSGSHSNYMDRVPENFKGPNIHCDEEENSFCESIQAYHNTILYLDNFLEALYRQTSAMEAIVLYFSDHGEVLHNIKGKEYLYGHGLDLMTKSQFKIPFLFWTTSSFQSKHPSLVKRLLLNLDKKTELSSFFDSITAMLNIQSSYIDPSFSFFNEEFQENSQRKVLNRNFSPLLYKELPY